MDSLNKTPKDGSKSKQGQRLIWIIAGILVLLLILIGSFGYNYVQTSLKPLDPNSNQKIEVKIPIGSTNKQIGAILEDKKVIKNGFIFDYYVRTKKFASFKAGYYELKPSMTLTQIAKELQKGGSSTPINSGKVLVREGVTADEIGDEIQAKTKYSKKDFLALLNNQTFLEQLKAKYPALLTSALDAQNVRYHLEGYLYPATYVVTKKTTLKQLVEQMVAKSNEVFSPYFAQIQQKGWSVQYALSLASLVEREGVTKQDRYKIAGVFENRLEKGMMIQSDISVLYALGQHKAKVTYADLEVDSPYNLYKNQGVGPGPYNNPSVDSLEAVLNPKDKDKGYLYFVANMKTGKVYFSQTYEQHQALTAKLAKDNNDAQ